MDVLLKALEGLSAADGVLLIIFIISAVWGAIKFVTKAYSGIKKHFFHQKDEVDEYQSLKDEIDRHSASLDKGNRRFEAINNSLENITKMIEDQKKAYCEDMVATYRSSIWRQHRDFTTQGFVTETGLKTFKECVDRYTDRGGNDIVHSKLLPEILALPVKYDLGE